MRKILVVVVVVCVTAIVLGIAFVASWASGPDRSRVNVADCAQFVDVTAFEGSTRTQVLIEHAIGAAGPLRLGLADVGVIDGQDAAVVMVTDSCEVPMCAAVVGRVYAFGDTRLRVDSIEFVSRWASWLGAPANVTVTVSQAR